MRDDVLAVATATGAVLVWTQGGRTSWLEAQRELVALRATANGFLVGDAEGRILELSGPKRSKVVREADGTRINHVDVSADTMLVTRRFGGVEVRSLDGELRHVSPGWSSSAFSSFSADGKRYLSIAPDRAHVYVRSVADGRISATYEGSSGAIDAGFVTPSVVLVVGRVENVVFDASPRLPRHLGEVTGLFVLDGRLFSTGLDGALLAHRVGNAELVEQLDAGIDVVRADAEIAVLRDVNGKTWRFDGRQVQALEDTSTATATKWPLGGKEGRACHERATGLDCANAGSPVTVVERFEEQLVAGTTDGHVRFFPLSGAEARLAACATLARFDRPCLGTSRSAE